MTTLWGKKVTKIPYERIEPTDFPVNNISGAHMHVYFLFLGFHFLFRWPGAGKPHSLHRTHIVHSQQASFDIYEQIIMTLEHLEELHYTFI